MGLWLMAPFTILCWQRPDLTKDWLGFDSPEMRKPWLRLNEPGRWWHDFKNLVVEWTRLNIQRSVKAHWFLIGLLLILL